MVSSEYFCSLKTENQTWEVTWPLIMRVSLSTLRLEKFSTVCVTDYSPEAVCVIDTLIKNSLIGSARWWYPFLLRLLYADLYLRGPADEGGTGVPIAFPTSSPPSRGRSSVFISSVFNKVGLRSVDGDSFVTSEVSWVVESTQLQSAAESLRDKQNNNYYVTTVSSATSATLCVTIKSHRHTQVSNKVLIGADQTWAGADSDTWT